MSKDILQGAEYIIGVDPGADGGMAVARVDTNGTPAPYPLRPDFFRAHRSLLEGLSDKRTVAVIEKVGASPQQKKSDVFTFGKNTGIWYSPLEMLGIPHIEVLPQKWQYGLNAPKGDYSARKRYLAKIAYSLFGEELGRSCTQRISDAILIAYYGQQKVRGVKNVWANCI